MAADHITPRIINRMKSFNIRVSCIIWAVRVSHFVFCYVLLCSVVILVWKRFHRRENDTEDNLHVFI